MSDKAREDFDEWFEATGINRTFSEALKAWLAAKEKYEPRWISMEERTPSDRNPVLVYCPETVVRFMACYFEEDEEWIFFGASCEPLTHQVTHWMPLPILPPSTQGGGE